MSNGDEMRDGAAQGLKSAASPGSCRVLVQAEADRFERLRSLLEADGGPPCDCRRVSHPQPFPEDGEAVWLLDHAPQAGCDAWAWSREAAQRGAPTPIVIVAPDELVPAPEGVTDWLPESRLDAFTLGRAVRHAWEKCRAAREIAALKEAVKEGREQAQMLRAIVNHQPVIVGRIDARGVVTAALGSLLKDYGMEANRLLGSSVFTLCPEAAGHIRNALAGESVDFSWSGRILGTERRLHNHLCFDEERGEGAVFFARDLTETQQTERALAESRQQFQLLLERSLDAILLIDNEGVCIEANQAACEALGRARKQLVGRRATEFAGKEFEPLQADALAKSFFQSARRYHVSSVACPDGQQRLLEYSVYRASPHFHLCILRDITERRRLEREILEVSDRERQRLSQDLHDGLGQHLAGVGYMSEALSARLSACASPHAGVAAQIADLIAHAGGQARDMARSLSPVKLDARCLPDALDLLAVNARKIYGLNCRLEMQGEIPPLPGAAAMHLYRIAQEALNNAQRHSRASAVVIRLACGGGQLVLSVQDDGGGFPQGADMHRLGLGLHMMNYRATLLGGALTVRPAQQGGTLITCTLQTDALEKFADEPGAAADSFSPD